MFPRPSAPPSRRRACSTSTASHGSMIVGFGPSAKIARGSRGLVTSAIFRNIRPGGAQAILTLRFSSAITWWWSVCTARSERRVGCWRTGSTPWPVPQQRPSAALQPCPSGRSAGPSPARMCVSSTSPDQHSCQRLGPTVRPQRPPRIAERCRACVYLAGDQGGSSAEHFVELVPNGADRRTPCRMRGVQRFDCVLPSSAAATS